MHTKERNLASDSKSNGEEMKITLRKNAGSCNFDHDGDLYRANNVKVYGSSYVLARL